ncbi:MAG: chemotaxis protein CheA [Balneolaceae bacterium]|nr:chemotaxis protein CheA [Balneolaceae bacterium]MCH8548234.1 chemotaxis protein CheA [Balneolaceae bacterium]
MSGKNKQHLNDLEEIIRLLADVWPNDLENVALAGAKFEDVIEGFSENVGQLQKLIDLAWQGLRHLYEKDAYFMRVKTATMMAVNSIREYVLNDGDLQVEEFERACSELDKALTGDGESADTVVELGEEVAEKVTNKDKQTTGSLDDAASLLMSIDEKKPEKEQIIQLNSLLKYLAQTEEVAVAEHIAKALKALDGSRGWLGKVSGHLEDAINEGSGDDWDQSEPEEISGSAPASADSAEKPANDSSETHFIIPQDVEEGMVGEFVTECSDLIETAESTLLDLEERPNDDELINTIFRAFHTIKGTSAFMGFDPISEFTHSVETLLSMVREGDLPFDRTCADINLKSIDIIKQMLAVVETAGPGDPLPKPQGYDALMRVLHKICEEGATPSEEFDKERDEIYKETSVAEEVTEEGAAEALQPGGDGAQASKSEAESTVRVNVSRLDRLIDMVGELVIAHSVVAQDDAISKDAELLKKVNHTSKILRELQDTSLTLRMVPLKATFHKMNRLVRDLARKAGKKVKFSTVGEDTEIDRNMVDVINEPLVHMLRNALDHGIEDPEKRAKSKKAETANIWLRAFQEGGKVVIEIEDDGGGIDKDVILNKAIEKGLVDPEKKLTDSEIYRLIFLPGFSSKDQVTDLSGRGVGMDVVRRNIEQLQGKIEVTSELGKGTKISIELPFTLAITDGMLVRVGEQRFIVPTINIDMTFRAEEDDLYTVLGNSEQVSFRGKSVPVIRLHKLFSIEGATEDLLNGTLLVIKNNNKRYALLVDEVIGQQQLVGKSINMMVKMEHISGGAILGDGQVGLILDTNALMLN